jgi:hypothetical protein
LKRERAEMAPPKATKMTSDSETAHRREAANAEEGAAPSSPPASHARMATPPDAPPGIEFDSKGHVIPVAKRTKTHREDAEHAEHEE